MNRLEKLENELNINYGKNTVKRWREELKYFKVIRFEWDKGSFADAFILRYEFMTKRHLLFFCEFLEILPIFKNESEIAIDEKWEYSDVLYGFKSPGWMKINKQDVYVSHCNGKDSKIIELEIHDTTNSYNISEEAFLSVMKVEKKLSLNTNLFPTNPTKDDEWSLTPIEDFLRITYK